MCNVSWYWYKSVACCVVCREERYNFTATSQPNDRHIMRVCVSVTVTVTGRSEADAACRCKFCEWRRLFRWMAGETGCLFWPSICGNFRLLTIRIEGCSRRRAQTHLRFAAAAVATRNGMRAYTHSEEPYDSVRQCSARFTRNRTENTENRDSFHQVAQYCGTTEYKHVFYISNKYVHREESTSKWLWARRSWGEREIESVL